MLGAIINKQPHPLESTLLPLIQGFTQGYDKVSRRGQTNPAYSELPLETAERLTAQLENQKAMTEQRKTAWNDALQGGDVNAALAAGMPLNQWLYQQMTPDQQETYVNNMVTGKPRAVTSQDESYLQNVNLYEQDSEGKKIGVPTRVRVPNKWVADITRMNNIAGSGLAKDLFLRQIDELPGGFAEEGETEFRKDTLAEPNEVLNGIDDYVLYSVYAEGNDPADAADNFFEDWEEERDQRGWPRNDVVPDLPDEETQLAWKLGSILRHVDPSEAEAIEDVIDNRDLAEMREVWDTIKEK